MTGVKYVLCTCRWVYIVKKKQKAPRWKRPNSICRSFTYIHFTTSEFFFLARSFTSCFAWKYITILCMKFREIIPGDCICVYMHIAHKRTYVLVMHHRPWSIIYYVLCESLFCYYTHRISYYRVVCTTVQRYTRNVQNLSF